MDILLANKFAAQLLPEVKRWLRRSSSNLESEVRQTVAACLLDMKRVGIVNISADDPLIQQAIKHHAKANFGYDDDSEKWDAAYTKLRDALSLSGDYNGGKPDG